MNEWIAFQNDKCTKLASLKDHVTVGSAEANPIQLFGKGVKPLHGQFLIRDGKIFFRDFFLDSVHSLSERALVVGEWKGKRFSDEELWRDYGGAILESFKNNLKSSPQNVEEALQKLSESWFLNTSIPSEVKNHLVTQFNELSLAGPVERLLSLEKVTDVLVTRFDEIWIEESGELKLSVYEFSSPETYQIYIENLLSSLHKSIDENIPFLDFVLANGSRGHLIAPPLTDGAFYLSIRKVRKDYFTLDDLFSREMFNEHTLLELKRALERRDNILISGATGSGKTTLIKALLHSCPERERILVAEDTPELQFNRPNTAFLRTRNDLNANLRAIDLRELVRQSLRMRPDRIVLGEVRGEEALDLLHAMNTGHQGCMGSLHANSGRDALFRLQGLAQMSSANLSEAVTRDLIARNIQLVLHCERMANGHRKLQQICYVRGIDNNQILLETKVL